MVMSILLLIVLLKGTFKSYFDITIEFLDYVDEMKKLLFSLPRAVMKETFTRYSSKAPGSLTCQF